MQNSHFTEDTFLLKIVWNFEEKKISGEIEISLLLNEKHSTNVDCVKRILRPTSFDFVAAIKRNNLDDRLERRIVSKRNRR